MVVCVCVWVGGGGGVCGGVWGVGARGCVGVWVCVCVSVGVCECDRAIERVYVYACL